MAFSPQVNDLRISLLVKNLSPSIDGNLLEKTKMFTNHEDQFHYILQPPGLSSPHNEVMNDDMMEYLPSTLIEYYQLFKHKLLNQIKLIHSIVKRQELFNIYFIESQTGQNYIMMTPTAIEILDLIKWMNKYQLKNFGNDIWCSAAFGGVKFVKVGDDIWQPCPPI